MDHDIEENSIGLDGSRRSILAPYLQEAPIRQRAGVPGLGQSQPGICARARS